MSKFCNPQAPVSVEFSRQEYWSGLPFPSAWDLPHSGIKPISLVSESHSVVSNSLWLRGLYSPGNSPGQNSGVDSLSLLQGIFPTRGSNPGLPNCRQILYQLSHKGNPRILEWVAYPFSNRSSWLRNWPGISCTAHRFLPTELSGKPASLISPVLQELAPSGKPQILIRKLL